MSTSLRKGTASDVDSGFSPIHMKISTAAPAMTNSANSLILPEIPFVVDLVTFRKSS